MCKFAILPCVRVYREALDYIHKPMVNYQYVNNWSLTSSSISNSLSEPSSVSFNAILGISIIGITIRAPFNFFLAAYGTKRGSPGHLLCCVQSYCIDYRSREPSSALILPEHRNILWKIEILFISSFDSQIFSIFRQIFPH